MARSPAASITPNQAIEAIKEMTQSIDQDESLKRSSFGRSVRAHLMGMKARLEDGARMTGPMQTALDNWNTAIHRDHKVDSKDTVQ